MINKFIGKIGYYVDQYELEKQIYSKGPDYLKRGWLGKKEFLEICLWKTRRPKKLYFQNTKEEIKEATRLAFSEKDEEQKILYLLGLKGVSIGVASAILSVVYPDDYAVIDAKSVKSLKRMKLIAWEDMTIAHWLEYLEVIRELRAQVNILPRDIERALVSYNRINIDAEFKEVYI